MKSRMKHTREFGARGKCGKYIGENTGRKRGMEFMQHQIISTIGTFSANQGVYCWNKAQRSLGT